MRAELDAGRQAYVVFPMVDASDKVPAQSLQEAEHALRSAFAPYRVAIIHGRLNPEEKRTIMHRFKEGSIRVLMSTTVVEVGVDIANATVMVVEDADRFGLSQLHQLRGRVGRGCYPGLCLLIAQAATEEARARLQVMASTTDGFEIAQRDLEIRGPGELMGTRQSGLPEIVFANLVRDAAVVEQARREALAILDSDPTLQEEAHQPLARELERTIPGSKATRGGWLISPEFGRSFGGPRVPGDL